MKDLDLPTKRMIWAQQFKIMEAEEMRTQIQSFEPKFSVVNVDEILKLN